MICVVLDARRATKIVGRRTGCIILATCLVLAANDPALAYAQGTISQKAQPIIDVLKDVARPVAYGCYIWAAIKYILGHQAEALSMAKGVTWGYIGVQVAPWMMDIIDGIGG